ncbi:MAG: xanthine dehydrogenase family protein molybdopterin-binding subunit, partial [Betaproteobacteria bacterium]
DTAAKELGFDRVELRRKNLVRPEAMPYRNAVGMTYDSGTYESNMDTAMKIADWSGFEARRSWAAARGKLLGLGLSNYVESSIGSPRERAEITVTPAGRVKVVIGTQPSGQGHETSFAQVVSSLLHVPVDAIDILFGDTDVVSVGGGSHSGRSMRHAATVFSMAAKELIEKGKKIVAYMQESSAAEIRFANGCFSAPHALRTFSFPELARDSEGALLPRELSGGLAVIADNEMHDPVFPNGCAICECEVDPETGSVEITRFAAVDDVGRCINPLIVHGQTHGGAAQGIGQAISEIYHVDATTGQPLTGSLMDYALPRADSVPSFSAEIVEVLSPTNPLGIKAAGEGATTPAPAAVINAIVDALRKFGVRDITMPATPQNIWRAIQEARK